MHLKHKTIAAIMAGCLLCYLVPAMGGDEFEGSAEERAALMEKINQERTSIEARKNELTRHELSTKTLREQIKQKWSKLHYYSEGNEVVRVKTYPYDGISTRTEEFYFNDGSLIFAIIQDQGLDEGTAGETGDRKEYYYWNGQFVGERQDTVEKERSIRHSDEERLESEAAEYLEIYREHFE